MRYPSLVKSWLCKTPVSITLYSGHYSEDGEPQTAATLEALCNYQDSARQVLSADKELIEISGTAYFCNDIAPSLEVISSGTLRVNGGETRTIFRGEKARNPDGTVNFVKLELI